MSFKVMSPKIQSSHWRNIKDKKYTGKEEIEV